MDSLKLAQRLSRLAQEKAVVLDALFEVNVTRDPAKHGLPPEELAPLLDTLLKEGHPGLRLRGLMTIGPYPATEADSRASFARLRELRDDCRKALRAEGLQRAFDGHERRLRRRHQGRFDHGADRNGDFGERDYSKK